MSKKAFLSFVVLAVGLLASPMGALACSVCLGGSPDDPVTNAYNWSILFLMATPYAVIGSVGGWLFFSHRRSSGKDGQPADQEPLLHPAWDHQEGEKK